MTPVAIGDTQGTLQARKTFKTIWTRPETFLRVYTRIDGVSVIELDNIGYLQFLQSSKQFTFLLFHDTLILPSVNVQLISQDKRVPSLFAT